MCFQCWAEDGRPEIDTPQVRETAEAIAAVFELSCVGGSLHIAIDDYNLADSNLDFCACEIEKCAAKDPELALAERLCLERLRALSEPERLSAVALHDGLWAPPGSRWFCGSIARVWKGRL